MRKLGIGVVVVLLLLVSPVVRADTEEVWEELLMGTVEIMFNLADDMDRFAADQMSIREVLEQLDYYGQDTYARLARAIELEPCEKVSQELKVQLVHFLSSTHLAIIVLEKGLDELNVPRIEAAVEIMEMVEAYVDEIDW